MEPSNWLVVCLGMGTVFFGLICLIAICKITSFAVMLFEKKKTPEEQPILNKQEILAAVCAAIAEETGFDVKNVRVLSFKKI
ncbi:MAG: OadG family protein [Clostridia bacterium]|nr:OadG family protein [Clostridia bacterium]